MRGFGRYAPPIVWMGVIAVLSGDLFAARETFRLLRLLASVLPWASPTTLHGLHAGVRKLAHLVEYGILTALWLRALAPGRSPRGAARWAIGLAAAYALVDEARQSLAPTRSPALIDVAIDAAGAFLAVGWLQAPAGLAAAGLRLLRWAAVVVSLGSIAAAIVDWSLGLAVWDLGLAALGAAAAVWGLLRLERRWRGRPHLSPDVGGDSPRPGSGVSSRHT
ncbi:MAG: VanZ family protein [Candidatus Rokuibacteriota bacterium]